MITDGTSKWILDRSVRCVQNDEDPATVVFDRTSRCVRNDDDTVTVVFDRTSRCVRNDDDMRNVPRVSSFWRRRGSIFKRLTLLPAATLLALASSGAAAQTYPTKPITLIVPFATGGSTDIVARIVGHELSGSLGKPVLVDNRTGGGGVVGWSAAARAAPDGHTLLAAELSFAIAAGLIPNLPYDARKSFAPITIAVSVPHVMVVHPSVKARNVQELIAFAKANPGKLFYGSGGNGTNTHLGSELFKSVAGVDLVHVPYKGAGAVLQDLMSGQVQMLVSSLTTTLPHIRSGKLNALMTMAEARAPVLPEVPSAREAGLPRLVMLYWAGFSAPAGTPQPIVDRLNREIVTAINAPDTRKRLADLGLDPVGGSPAQAAKLIDDEIQRWSAVIKTANIKAD